jgi:hypothetical protein
MALRVATGTYTGNASSRSITGLGFQPKVLFIHGNNATDSGSGQVGVLRSGTSCSSFLSSDNTTDDANITSLDSDGFSVIANGFVNRSGTTYNWFAVGGDDADIKVGSYTGNATDNRSITGVGFTPRFVLVKGLNNDEPCWKFGSQTGDVSFIQGLFGTEQANGVQAFEADGFQIGTDVSVNTNSTTYYYVAIRDITDSFDSGSYTGNNTDNRSITGIGFQPTAVIVTRSLAATRNGVFTTASNGADDTVYVSSQAVNFANGIQALESDGFQVGTSTLVNANSATYYYIAVRSTPATTANSGFFNFM